MNQQKERWTEFVLFTIFLLLWLMVITNRKLKDNSLWLDFSKNTSHPFSQILDDTNLWVNSLWAVWIPVIQVSDMQSPISYSKEILHFFQNELCPTQKYSIDYWSNSGFQKSLYNGAVPQSFLESDEDAKHETKNQHAKMSEPENGETYQKEKLLNYDYLKKYFYIVDETTSLRSSDLNPEKLLSCDLSFPISSKEPTVLIYHTHGSEAYSDGGSVIEVGDTLQKNLESQYGICVIHDRTIYDQINGELDRSKAYDYAGSSVSEQLRKHPSIQMVLDIHRDSVDSSTHLITTIRQKKTAQIMFFNGVSYRNQTGDIAYLENPNKSENLAFSLQMQLLALKYFHNFTRKIYIKGYRYNLHLKKRAALIEVGAENNTLQEAKNAMTPLSELIYRLSQGEKAY